VGMERVVALMGREWYGIIWFRSTSKVVHRGHLYPV
jgi:hypothetical protein